MQSDTRFFLQTVFLCTVLGIIINSNVVSFNMLEEGASEHACCMVKPFSAAYNCNLRKDSH